MSAAIVLFFSAFIVAPGQVSERQGSYNERMFADAIANRDSSSPPFVLVTIVDGMTHTQKTGCVEASSLAAAIALQNGWTRENKKPTPSEVDQIPLGSPGRSFTFRTARWLAGSGYYAMTTPPNQQACLLLRQGIPAFMADLTGEVIAGTPGHALAAVPPRNGS